MSHTIEIAKTEIKDFELLNKACQRENQRRGEVGLPLLPLPSRSGEYAQFQGQFPLAEGSRYANFSIHLPTGRITGDSDYRQTLDAAVQAIVPHYGAEMAIAEAEANGYAWQFAEAPSGEVELVIEAF